MNEQNQKLPFKPHQWIILVVIFCCVAVFICTIFMVSKNDTYTNPVNIEIPATSAIQATPTNATFDLSQDQLTQLIVTRYAVVGIVVTDTQQATVTMEKIVEMYSDRGATFIAKIGPDYPGMSVSMLIRVPAEEFDVVMDYIAGMAVRVNDRGEVKEDYQAEYIDQRVHIESLEAVRDRLVVLSKQSTNLEEVLHIEELINQRETEIESIKGDIKFLAESRRFGEISLNMEASAPPQPAGATLVPIQPIQPIIQNIGQTNGQLLDVQPTPENLIIHKGTVTLAVSDPQTAIHEIQKLVAELSGEGARIFDRADKYFGSDLTTSMKICVPSDKFEEVMDRLAGLAIEPEYPEERAQDVNAEFSELISRLNALEATRDHLMNTLNRAANADQALRIEQELTQLDTEVVAIKGKMKLLVESVQLSEIDLNLYPHYTTSSVIASQSAEQLKKSQNFIIYILLGMIVLLLPWLASARIRARIFDFAGRLQKGK
jgi:hypothetical protein